MGVNILLLIRVIARTPFINNKGKQMAEEVKSKLEMLLKQPATPLQALSDTPVPVVDNGYVANQQLNDELNNTEPLTEKEKKEAQQRANRLKVRTHIPEPMTKEIHPPMLTSEALLIERIVLSINTFKDGYKSEPLGIVLSKAYEPTLKSIRSMFIKSDEPILEIMGLKIQYTVAPDMVMCL